MTLCSLASYRYISYLDEDEDIAADDAGVTQPTSTADRQIEWNTVRVSFENFLGSSTAELDAQIRLAAERTQISEDQLVGLNASRITKITNNLPQFLQDLRSIESKMAKITSDIEAIEFDELLTDAVNLELKCRLAATKASFLSTWILEIILVFQNSVLKQDGKE